ncbi:MAG: M28 family peptidase [Deltaproteobacteria bacterium]|nr:M28 family peptidase [Deltaproteobacteria bacterium]
MSRATSVRDVLAAFAILLISCVRPHPPPRRPRPVGADLSAATALLRDAEERAFGLIDGARAMELVAELDRGFRVRGNEPYGASMAAIERELVAALPRGAVSSFGAGGDLSAWTPRSAALELRAEGLSEGLSFDRPEDVARTMLAINSFSTPPDGVDAEVRLLGAGDVRGAIALGGPDPALTYERAVVQGGALGVLIAPEREGPGGPDGIPFGEIPYDPARRSFGVFLPRRLAWAVEGLLRRGARVKARVRVETSQGTSRARTIVATLPGGDARAKSIVLCAHVDEPGANDNASGAAALVEVARALPRIDRTVRLIWGTEIESPAEWLRSHGSEVEAAIALDMVGEDPRAIGPLLVERTPDPGAIWTRPPDRHTGWGEAEVDPATIRGSALAAVVVAALGTRAPGARTNPFEGGSDHEPFLDRGIPAVLVWHFPDDAYHTSLDRTGRVSASELRRVAAGVVAAVELLGRTDAAARDAALAIAEDAAVRRVDQELAASLRALAGGSPLAHEERILAAWGRFHDEALDGLAPARELPRARARVAARLERALRRLRSETRRSGD